MLISLVVGAVIGYIAGKIMNTKNTLIINIILGILGSFVGSVVFGFLGFSSTSIISEFIIDVIGACLVVFLYRKFE